MSMDSMKHSAKPRTAGGGNGMPLIEDDAIRGPEHEVLGDEYEHTAVPQSARRSLFSISMVWIGFPMIITGAMTGSILVAGMGFMSALWAMIIGNVLLFAYIGANGVLGTTRGHTFALIASAVFALRSCHPHPRNLSSNRKPTRNDPGMADFGSRTMTGAKRRPR